MPHDCLRSFFSGFIYFKGGLFLYGLLELQTLTLVHSAPMSIQIYVMEKEACVQILAGSLLLCAMND